MNKEKQITCKVCQEQLKTVVNESWKNGKVYCRSCYYLKFEKPKLLTSLAKSRNRNHE